MPETDAGRKERRDIRLPGEIWGRIDSIAGHEGEPPAAVLREVVKLGLPVKESQVFEADTKRLINRRLHAKEDGALEAIEVLKRTDVGEDERLAAIEKIEEWLRKG